MRNINHIEGRGKHLISKREGVIISKWGWRRLIRMDLKLTKMIVISKWERPELIKKKSITNPYALSFRNEKPTINLYESKINLKDDYHFEMTGIFSFWTDTHLKLWRAVEMTVTLKWQRTYSRKIGRAIFVKLYIFLERKDICRTYINIIKK